MRNLAIAQRRPGWVGYGFLGLVLLLSILPLYWSFLVASGDSTSARDPNLSWFPGGHFLENAISAISNPAVNFWKALGNSILVSVTVSASVVFFSTLAGYAFAKLKFKGRGPLLVFIIATVAVPTQLGVVPLYLLMAQYGWIDTMQAVIVPALVNAFGVFWMTQYLSQALPDEIIEAARVDGASSFRSFWSIALPIARPAATMLALFTFVASWTNFFWPFIVLSPQNPTLPVALSLLQANYFVDYSIVLAGTLVATVPLLILFVVAGKQLVSGIMQGAIK
ncbi:carbohydrate ABC transporter permease [Protaetiibacter sp. 10F1B-8-1]|uniref:Carbohydrate ABC transporter permease n=2 Tax=Protaetiibacter mangrovi TaxID=2970926 RepID=A0ABT1ZET0_9MICO|nr:carbohydrate ABC transporter permease [Protaetiibacter mangrovi]MCS0499205.1 carbohydrate ABC transporter permease [Protaetiibacter mangrovi]